MWSETSCSHRVLLLLVQQASETYEDLPMEPEVYTPPEDPKKARLRDLERERAAKVGSGAQLCSLDGRAL